MKERYFKELFSFTRQDRRGLLVLFTLLVVIIIFHFIVDLIYGQKNESIDYIVFDQKVAELEKFNTIPPKKSFIEISQNKNNKSFFNFDPNKASVNELEMLGLNKFQRNNILKYREKGGIFKEASDLRKIYGIDEVLYNELEPYIIVNAVNQPEINKEEDNRQVFEFEKKTELNLAKWNELRRTGLNDTLSSRILKYRDLLGGFYSFDQLNEVYGIDSLSVGMLKRKFTIDTSLIKRIPLNNTTYSELKKNPYLNKFQVDAILKFKKNNKKIESTEDLLNYNLLDKRTFEKISHYIDTQ